MSDQRNAADRLSLAQERTPRKRPQYGVTSEACSAAELGLDRFASEERFYQPEEKSDYERLLNPFGDKWAARKRKNRFIPTMTGSLTRLLERHDGPEVSPLTEPSQHEDAGAYAQFLKRAASDLHYDETIGHLRPDMARLKRVKAEFQAAGVKKKFIGYTVVNFDNNLLMPKSENLPESFYLHSPEASQRPEDRLWFSPGASLVDGGHVFDTRKAEVRSAICQAILRRLIDNDVDGVLIDYAVRPFAFGAPQLIDVMPRPWFDTFQEVQLRLVEELYETLKPYNKLLFLNGVMLDSITVTDPRLVRLFAKHCDGMMWEQPFRWEWRTFDNGDADYYDRLEQFFDIFAHLGKKLIVKAGSYRFHATEHIEPSWNARFKKTNYGVERHLAKYNTCFFLIFFNRFFSILFLTHPTKLKDIYASEAYFDFWDCEIGEALGAGRRLSRDVMAREFEHAVVFVNNTLEPFEVSPALTPEGFSSAVPKITLAPLSGEIWIKPGVRILHASPALAMRRSLQQLRRKNLFESGVMRRFRRALRDARMRFRKTTRNTLMRLQKAARNLALHAVAFSRGVLKRLASIWGR